MTEPMMSSRFQLYLELAERTARILARNPHLRGRILGTCLRYGHEATSESASTKDIRTDTPQPREVACAQTKNPFERSTSATVPSPIDAQQVIRAVETAWQLPAGGLLINLHPKRVAQPRLAAYWLLYRELAWSQRRIGGYFGRDRSTVSGGLRRVADLLRINILFQTRLADAERLLRSALA